MGHDTMFNFVDVVDGVMGYSEEVVEQIIAKIIFKNTFICTELHYNLLNYLFVFPDNLLGALNQLGDALTELDRILTTPLPFSYVALLFLS